MRTFGARAMLFARGALDGARSLLPYRFRHNARMLRQRAAFAERLSALPRAGSASGFKSVLVDASWDNANYWYRYSILRSALGIAPGAETAVIGPHKRRVVLTTLKALGVSRCEDFQTLVGQEEKLRESAAMLLRTAQRPADILAWRLPSDLPPSILYDGIIKRQRAARVDLAHPLLLDHIAEALGSIAAAEALLDKVRPELVVLSHAIEFRYGSIAWCALRRNIPVIVAFGNYGLLRYCKLSRPEDFFETVDRPDSQQIDALDAEIRQRLADRGLAYLGRRMSGATDDIGARYAFGANIGNGPSRGSICQEFGWDESKPIVAVYASNWFDYPHGVGMRNFSDFLDWLEVTLEAVKSQTGCNWLFRAHPCDRWYGGITLADLMAEAPMEHIRLCPIEWNGAHVQTAVDGLVTVHGTAGIEYAAAGKPVLLADRGWYHDVGFAHHCTSREAYVAALLDPTWLTMANQRTTELAAIFAGMYFCPSSETNVPMGDDSEQDRLHGLVDDMVSKQVAFVHSEIAAVAQWWNCGAAHFHTWQVLRDVG
ncbi:hypothetical protein [Hyphomicrobium sp.]|uniref:hypothetical protein n=1 Tax=Hyphomicrobium sp. TaxID=82 RepID=UPI0025C07AD6|nr:hypothetical protein [Hyphomicrobium sp.]MCC7250946.1 hypothetical protein [Hyphomicrobium sp.]